MTAKRKTTQPAGGIKWTLLRAATEFGVARETLRRGLRQLAIDVETDATYTTKQIFTALAGDLKTERIRETRARADLLERERREKDRELVPLAEVLSMVNSSHLPIRQRLNSLPSEMCKRANPGDPQLAHDALQRWVDESLPLIREGLPQPKK